MSIPNNRHQKSGTDVKTYDFHQEPMWNLATYNDVSSMSIPRPILHGFDIGFKPTWHLFRVAVTNKIVSDTEIKINNDVSSE